MPKTPGTELTVKLEILIDAGPEKVWRVLSTPEGMRRWQGARVYEPRPGGEIVFYLGPTGEPVSAEDAAYISRGEVKVFDPPRTLAYSWQQHNVKTNETWPAATLVTLHLEPAGTGTRVTVAHSGFELLPQGVAEAAFEDYKRGWNLHDDLGKLKRLAEEVL